MNATIVMAKNSFSSRYGEYYALIVVNIIPCILFFKDLTDTVFLSVHFPFYIASCLLIGFYWQEILHARSLPTVKQAILSRLLPAALVIIGLLIIFEVTSVSLRTTYRSNTVLFYLTTAVYIIFSLSMGLVLVIGGARLRKTLATAENMLGTNKNNRVRRMTGLLILAASSMIGIPIFIGVSVSWSNLWTLTPVHMFISAASIFICLVFQPKSSAESKENSKNSTGSAGKGNSSESHSASVGAADPASAEITLSNHDAIEMKSPAEESESSSSSEEA
eukprot:TRINITY_DN5296_c0_g1_i3.p1 TRINITY_DN5296_c0_g1~~TRINITY_DN5296_c0_g1_i3.p1  ORF type:complete len:297 (-),score=19.44 TRINITY_DN5296_c0_g1_i3:91-921(-)